MPTSALSRWKHDIPLYSGRLQRAQLLLRKARCFTAGPGWRRGRYHRGNASDSLGGRVPGKSRGIRGSMLPGGIVPRSMPPGETAVPGCTAAGGAGIPDRSAPMLPRGLPPVIFSDSIVLPILRSERSAPRCLGKKPTSVPRGGEGRSVDQRDCRTMAPASIATARCSPVGQQESVGCQLEDETQD